MTYDEVHRLKVALFNQPAAPRVPRPHEVVPHLFGSAQQQVFAQTVSDFGLPESDPEYAAGYHDGFALGQAIKVSGFSAHAPVGRSASYVAGWQRGYTDGLA